MGSATLLLCCVSELHIIEMQRIAGGLLVVTDEGIRR